MVAKMTALLCANDSAAGQGLKVLEIGCGSGYQAAVLAAMGLKVWSVERIGVLAAAAAERLRPLGVSVIHGDGRMGYPDAAPYDRVIVTAAASRVEAAWDAQLKRGGRLVAPINVTTGNQRLLVRDKLLSDTDGFRNTWYDYCRFVPLLGGVEE
jgi:protein-L-isoaspartate(D-aspartate) O-methyltransferase